MELNGHLFSMLKVGSRARSEEKIGDHGQEQTVNHYLLQRIEEADCHVERNPGEREPSCPIAASQQEHSTHECNELGELDQRVLELKGVPRENLGEMSDKANRAHDQIDRGEDRYGDWAFAHDSCASLSDAQLRLRTYHPARSIATENKPNGFIEGAPRPR